MLMVQAALNQFLMLKWSNKNLADQNIILITYAMKDLPTELETHLSYPTLWYEIISKKIWSLCILLLCKTNDQPPHGVF